MTDPSMTPETPTVAETVHFLRRFADLMSTGHNASYLHHAAVLLETMAVRLTAALDEEQLWRYKYETVTHHADLLEAECESLKHDIDGQLNVVASTVSERDELAATLQAREAELSGLRGEMDRERGELAAGSETHEQALAELRAELDRERAALQATVDQRGQELDQLRREAEREREEFAAGLKAREQELSELRLGLGRERDELTVRLKVTGDELEALRVVSGREHDALRAKVAALEAKRVELRSAFDQISHLQHQTIDAQAVAADRSIAEKSRPEAPLRPVLAVGETEVVVPRATLRQVRSQFEYLATEFTGVGDVASQVMCELGAFTMDLALGAGRKADARPVDDVARSILASPGSLARVNADTI